MRLDCLDLPAGILLQLRHRSDAHHLRLRAWASKSRLLWIETLMVDTLMAPLVMVGRLGEGHERVP